METKRTREEWLQEAREILATELFKEEKVPPKIRISCGLPSKKAFSLKNRIVGECFAPTASSDESHEIFISPVLSDPVRVLDTLAHEMIHAIVGIEAGHKGPFKRVATLIGLTGKMTSTTAGPVLADKLKAISVKLGAYPHAELKPARKLKKCGTRMIKLECGDCGYIVRTTQKWIEMGTPTCACGGMFDA